MAPGGGFIFTTIHNTQATVPPENYIAMWETLQKDANYE
jgi:uroporphyrinogen decarboxylase